MKRRFFTLDVFTSKKFAGNPLAVVLDAEGLDTDAMQAIAREFNLSETVFVLPPSDPAHRADLRIFVPTRELPFAGHPTVGTAVLLGLLDGKGGTFTLGEKIGPVACVVTVGGAGEQVGQNNQVGQATFTLPRLPAELGNPAPDAAIAAALGLAEADIGFGDHRPSVFSAGVGFTCVPVKDLAAIGRIKLDMARWDQGIRPVDHPDAFVYTRETTEAGHQYHARMFAPEMGIAEDPATGAAVAAFTGAILRFDKPADGRHDLVIEQGYEMGRPSQIKLGLEVRDGALVSATIGGAAIVVSEGHLHA
jgi:trans-2,3-dihydro-3-hydroxyanthranilate isomerase